MLLETGEHTLAVSFDDMHDLSATGSTSRFAPAIAQQARAAVRPRRAADPTKVKAAFEEANPGLIDGLRGIAHWHEFAASLLTQFDRRGSLSERQIAAGRQAVARAEERDMKRTTARREMSGAVDVSSIQALFSKASGSGLKKLKFQTDVLSISPAAADGRHAGSLHVVHAGQYAGRITSGAFVAATGAQSTTLALLIELAADPAGVSRMYGKKTGRCCCCGRELTNEISIRMGIGPICAERWGL